MKSRISECGVGDNDSMRAPRAAKSPFGFLLAPHNSCK